MKKEATVTASGEREIVVEREFDAPRKMVFAALTQPELLKRWFYGPGGWSLDICEIDLRVGGALRYVWKRSTSSLLMGMGGVYREVVPNERIVFTEVFDEAWYPGEALNTTVLVDHGTRTLLTTTTRYETKEARDGVLRSPAYDSIEETYARLEASIRQAQTFREMSSISK